MKKRAIVLILIILILLSFGQTAIADGSKDSGFSFMNEANEIDYLQSPAIEAYHFFLEEFIEPDIDCTNDTILIDFRYPVWYGGAYMDEEFNLCVKIVEGYASKIQSIAEIMKDYPVKYQLVDISYANLSQLQYEICENYDGWVSVLLSQKESKIIVRIDPKEEEGIALAETLSNKYSHISFEESGRLKPFTATDIIGGHALRQSNGLTRATVGFCCEYKPKGSSVMQEGFLTAGHVALSAQSNSVTLYLLTGATCPIYFDTSNSVIQFNSGDYGDFAFLPANGNTLTNQVQSSSSLTVYNITNDYTDEISDELEGTYVNKCGAVTGTTNGILGGMACAEYDREPIGKDYIYRVWEVYNYGLSANNPLSAHGDSGSPVWQSVGGVNTIIGILSGGPDTGDYVGQKYYFTPFDTMAWCNSGNDMIADSDFVLTLSS